MTDDLITREKLRELAAKADYATAAGSTDAFRCNVAFLDACAAYVRQLLAQPAGSGGVPSKAMIVAALCAPYKSKSVADGSTVSDFLLGGGDEEVPIITAALIAAMAAAPASPQGWMPIESAPRDGTRVLIYFAGLDHVEDATINEDGHCLFDGESFNEPPSHWLPLPALPAAIDAGREG